MFEVFQDLAKRAEDGVSSVPEHLYENHFRAVGWNVSKFDRKPSVKRAADQGVRRNRWLRSRSSSCYGAKAFFILIPQILKRGVESMYKSISPNVDFVEEEKKIKEFWDKEGIF